MEQDVYICKWFRSKDGWRLETVSHPVVLAKGSTYEEAEEDLCEQIRAKGGAIIPVLEFVPPLPKSTLEEKYCKPELLLLLVMTDLKPVYRKISKTKHLSRNNNELIGMILFIRLQFVENVLDRKAREMNAPWN